MLDGVGQLLIVFVAITLVGIALVLESKLSNFGLLGPLTLTTAVFALAYGIRPALMFNYLDYYGTFPDYYNTHDLSSFVMMELAYILGSSALIVGYCSKTSLWISRVLPDLHAVSVSRMYWLSLGMLLAACVAFAVMVPKLIQAGAVLGLYQRSTRTAFTELWKGNGLLFFFITESVPFFVTFVAASWLKKRGGLFSAGLSLCFFLVVLLLMAFLGSRQGVIGLVLSLLLFLHYRVARIPLFVQILMGAGLGLLGGILGLILVGRGASFEWSAVSMVDAIVRLTGTFDQSELLMAYIQKSEHFFFGGTFIEDLFVTYIPRAFVSFKPDIYGVVRLQDALFPQLYEIAGISATYPIGFFGEAYANLHVVGLIVFPMLFGMLLRALNEKAMRERALGMYVPLLAIVLGNAIGVARSFGGTLLSIAVLMVMFKVLFCTTLVREKAV